MSEPRRMDRREFLAASTVGAAAVGAGALSAPASGAALGANDRINIGLIGCGGQGTSHLRRLADMARRPEEKVRIAGVCDVYEPRKQRAKDLSGAPVFHHYQDLLAVPDLDAVLIATPDHWHANISVAALEAGKDVYCEKPMTLYWEEAKEVAEVVRRTGRVFQVGAQSTSDDIWWQANRLLREGALGKVLWSQSGYCRNSRGGEWNWGIDWDASPKSLDWDLWLGPAPKRPFDAERYFRFRKYWDYSGGIATDLLYHALGHMSIALGPEFPCRVTASGGVYAFPDREVPDTFHTMTDYPSGHTVVMAASMANRQGLPEVIRGHEATMTFEGPGLVIRPEDEYRGERKEISVGPRPRRDHLHNFLDCMRTRAQPHCNAETGCRVAVAICLGVKAYRENKVIRFDPEKEAIVA